MAKMPTKIKTRSHDHDGQKAHRRFTDRKQGELTFHPVEASLLPKYQCHQYQQYDGFYAAGSAFRALLNSSFTFALNAGMSSGLRLVTRLPSTTTS